MRNVTQSLVLVNLCLSVIRSIADLLITSGAQPVFSTANVIDGDEAFDVRPAGIGGLKSIGVSAMSFACGTPLITTVAELFPGIGSGVTAPMVALLLMLFPLPTCWQPT
jgi:hypothetical protein